MKNLSRFSFDGSQNEDGSRFLVPDEDSLWAVPKEDLAAGWLTSQYQACHFVKDTPNGFSHAVGICGPDGHWLLGQPTGYDFIAQGPTIGDLLSVFATTVYYEGLLPELFTANSLPASNR